MENSELEYHSSEKFRCGLVAVQMVAQAYGLPIRNVDEIFQYAKQKGYTNHGEMFP
ncbi:hypothetical protein WUBG_00710, partial [Wuchereria bancrofti]